MVSPDVDGYTETRNDRKVLQKAPKNYWKPKEH